MSTPGIDALRRSMEYIQELAAQLKAGGPLSAPPRVQSHASIVYNGKVVSKGRPRMGKHSVYTPAETREFEAAVKEAAREQIKTQNNWPMTGSVHAELFVYDAIPEKWPEWMKMLATSQYIFKKDRSDLDNKTKSILDALNGIIYKDDNQITKLTITRRYSKHDGFRAVFYRIGLSDQVLANIKKLMS